MLDVDISINVSDVNEYLKKTLENDENLRYLYVKGEISNYKIASNGAAYFTLSDDKSSISCVIFSNYRQSLKFSPVNGDAVKVLASLSVYVPRGSYSLRVYNIQKQGIGEALVKLEELKKKLNAEGLFDDSKKRPINPYPNLIGVITAANSAAIKDIIINIQRRYPLASIYFFPSAVQGDNAAKELIQAFEKSQQHPLDTLIIGRGGGSSEDLSAFNDESLVRAVAKSKCPVISAVGHEIDTTLIDLIADKRASTPTGAAELATANREDIEDKLINIDISIKEILKQKINGYESNLNYLKSHLNSLIISKLSSMQMLLTQKIDHLNDLNPLNILKRGYTLTVDENGNIIKSVNEIKIGQKITSIFNDGQAESNVERIKKDNGNQNN